MPSAPKTPTLFVKNEPIGRNKLPSNSPLHILDRWWRDKIEAMGRMPSRADVDPIALGKDIIPWLFILEVRRGGRRLDYRFRLLGTANIRMIGRDPTGRLASDVFRDDGENSIVRTSFDETVESGEPTYWEAALPHEMDFPITVYRAIFPLAADGASIDHLIAAAIPANVETSA